ncbi:MAG: TetR/AcrR family transcriptional regulator [Nitriliruptor sp.]
MPETRGATPPGPPTVRGQQRREAILDAAAALFLERGFHGASIDEVGAAAGISGPGVYRHVASKDALLMAVLDRLWSEGFGPAVRRGADLPPREALAGLIDAHVDLAIGQSTALVLLVTELRHLPGDYRDRALHNHRRYLDAWVGPLRQLRPDATDDEARGVATAIHGLIDSAARVPDLVDDVDPATRTPLLRRLAAELVETFVRAG